MDRLGHAERADVTGTARGAVRCAGMDRATSCCLVTNALSGSNDESARTQLLADIRDTGLAIAWHVSFPDEDLPTPAALDARGIGLVAIFTGDGSLNAALEKLAGWQGQVLVLPGGTQNLLSKRLHGDVSAADVLRARADGRVKVRRPGVIRCPLGHAYAELQAGPGTAWARVREAMRDGSVVELAQEGVAATAASLAAPGVLAREPALGEGEGYPLIVLTAHDDGIDVTAYHAEEVGDYLAQAAALLARNFREGPHTGLGRVPRITLASADGAPFGLLLDGEAVEPGAACAFELVEIAVDLLATAADG